MASSKQCLELHRKKCSSVKLLHHAIDHNNNFDCIFLKSFFWRYDLSLKIIKKRGGECDFHLFFRPLILIFEPWIVVERGKIHITYLSEKMYFHKKMTLLIFLKEKKIYNP